MHFEIYCREPNNDCNSVLLQEVRPIQDLHVAIIPCNFSCGIEMVFASVSNNIPKHATFVEGGVSFLDLSTKILE